MRSSFEIIAEILKTSKNGAKKTRIMYTVGLSYKFIQKYLNLLLETNLLRTGDSYHTTEKGIEFLRKYQTMELLLNTNNWHHLFVSGKRFHTARLFLSLVAPKKRKLNFFPFCLCRIIPLIRECFLILSDQEALDSRCWFKKLSWRTSCPTNMRGYPSKRASM